MPIKKQRFVLAESEYVPERVVTLVKHARGVAIKVNDEVVAHFFDNSDALELDTASGQTGLASDHGGYVKVRR